MLENKNSIIPSDRGISLPARVPAAPARFSPFFLSMKLAPMKVLDRTARIKPLMLSETPTFSIPFVFVTIEISSSVLLLLLRYWLEKFKSSKKRDKSNQFWIPANKFEWQCPISLAPCKKRFSLFWKEERAIEEHEREKNEEKETLEILAKTRIANDLLVLLELSGAESFRFYPGRWKRLVACVEKESA